MKPSISKKTQDYLKKLEDGKNDNADFHYSQLDAIDRLIYEEGLRIKGLYIDKDLDLILIILNNRKIIKYSVSNNQELADASDGALLNFENDGFGMLSKKPLQDDVLSFYGLHTTLLRKRAPSGEESTTTKKTTNC